MYIHTYIHTYTYIHAYIHTCIYTHMHACIHTYIHTYFSFLSFPRCRVNPRLTDKVGTSVSLGHTTPQRASPPTHVPPVRIPKKQHINTAYKRTYRCHQNSPPHRESKCAVQGRCHQQERLESHQHCRVKPDNVHDWGHYHDAE